MLSFIRFVVPSLAAGLVVSCAACSVASVTRPDGETRTEWSFGTVAASLDAAEGDLVEVKGLGIGSALDTVSAGYFKLSLYRAPAGCRVVVYPSRSGQVAEIAQLLKEHPDICAPPLDKEKP